MAAKRTQAFSFRLAPDSGVPVYRQLMDQVTAGVATGALRPGDQLPTVRQLAVDLAINPNTVIRAYREMELRRILESQQGSGTFISELAFKRGTDPDSNLLEQLVDEFVVRAAAAGFSWAELLAALERRRNSKTEGQGELI